MKEIELSKTGWKNKGKYKALVDNDIFNIVNQYNWTYNNNGYIYRYDYSTGKRKLIYLHRYIWELKKGEIPDNKEVEHWDENKLNNQISNLRLATRSENNCNRRKGKNNKSGFKGICKVVNKYEKKDGSISIYERWEVTIDKDKKRYRKTFPYNADGLAQAQQWYKEKSLELHKEFSIYNKDK